MKKLYYHPASYPHSPGVFVCIHCGRQTFDGMSESPCVVKTAHQTIINGYIFEVSVRDCKATLICYREIELGGLKNFRKHYVIETDAETYQKIDRLVHESVPRAGGAINFSGVYGICDELGLLLEEGLKQGKIRIEDARRHFMSDETVM